MATITINRKDLIYAAKSATTDEERCRLLWEAAVDTLPASAVVWTHDNKIAARLSMRSVAEMLFPWMFDGNDEEWKNVQPAYYAYLRQTRNARCLRPHDKPPLWEFSATWRDTGSTVDMSHPTIDPVPVREPKSYKVLRDSLASIGSWITTTELASVTGYSRHTVNVWLRDNPDIVTIGSVKRRKVGLPSWDRPEETSKAAAAAVSRAERDRRFRAGRDEYMSKQRAERHERFKSVMLDNRLTSAGTHVLARLAGSTPSTVKAWIHSDDFTTDPQFRVWSGLVYFEGKLPDAPAPAPAPAPADVTAIADQIQKLIDTATADLRAENANLQRKLDNILAALS